MEEGAAVVHPEAEILDLDLSPESQLASIFTAELLTTEQVAIRLGTTKHVLAAWRSMRCGPPFVLRKKSAIGYPPEGVNNFLRDREKHRQERQNPRAGKR
jgi:hypothetical protein